MTRQVSAGGAMTSRPGFPVPWFLGSHASYPKELAGRKTGFSW